MQLEHTWTCEEVEPLLPALAVGALDAEEQAAVQVHVLFCPWCLPHFQEYEAAATHLAYAVPVLEPPAALGARLLQAATARPAASPALVPLAAPVATPATNGVAVPARLASPPRRSLLDGLLGFYRQLAPAGFAAALLVMVMMGGWGMNMSSVAQSQQQTVAMLQMPGSHVVALQPMTETIASGTVAMAPDADKMGLMVANLMPQPGRVYQFWLVMKDGHIMPCGTVTVDNHGAAVLMIHLPVALAQSQGVMITDEPSGPAQVPTGTKWLEATY